MSYSANTMDAASIVTTIKAMRHTLIEQRARFLRAGRLSPINDTYIDVICPTEDLPALRAAFGEDRPVAYWPETASANGVRVKMYAPGEIGGRLRGRTVGVIVFVNGARALVSGDQVPALKASLATVRDAAVGVGSPVRWLGHIVDLAEEQDLL